MKKLLIALGLVCSLTSFADVYTSGYMLGGLGEMDKFDGVQDTGRVNSDEEGGISISFTGDHVYTTYNSNVLKKCDLNGNCNNIDTFASTPLGVSFDNNGNGYVITASGNLDAYVDDKFVGVIKQFNEKLTSISFTGSNIYLGVQASPGIPNELLKCDLNGNCNQSSVFDSSPLGISFDNNGNGYVVTENGHLDKYTNNQFVKTIHNFDDVPLSVSFTGDAVWGIYVSTTHHGGEVRACEDGGSCPTIWSRKNINKDSIYPVVAFKQHRSQ